ncbi:4-alpha-glucanotransferase [Chthoniobacter sp.]|uniref:4-alpha-glucanotransferase n=1 Tax=Chthoniobacter sp. TaxID=2510640 RepID=UPI0032AF097A
MELSPDQKLAGVLAPLFALRGQNDLGVGDVGALREFIDWSAEQGFRVVQLLPVNETGNDNSPYNAISSVALEPTTIEITPEALPDLSAEEIAEIKAAADPGALCEGPVLYPAIKALKWKLLNRAFENFLSHSWKKNDRRARAFRVFLKSEAAWLNGYAFFRVLIEENGGTERWDMWPTEQRSFAQAQAWLAVQKPAKRHEIEQRLRLVSYVQWIAWDQWRGIHDYATSNDVSLMGDIPFGVSYYSADVWTRPELFDHIWCGGCPPERVFETDPFTYKWGQNWGIPLYRWEVHREQGFDWWRQRVRKVRACFHLFRIDHILGFFRVYGFPWRPQSNAQFLPLTEDEAREKTGGELPHFCPYEDDTAAHKAANCAQGREVLEVLLEECGEFRLIGEDLGVVPDYVRPCLTELGIAGFKIPYWEETAGQMTPGSDYQRLSVTTYATHDFEPIRVTWENWMAKIEAAEHGGLETHAARDRAWLDVRRLGAWVGLEVPRITPYSDKVYEALMRGLFASNSWMAIYMITDLFATAQRFNVPGAVSESNWSQRLLYPMVLWRKDSALKSKMKRVREILRTTGRV